MERGVNAIPGWQLELVVNLVDLPRNRERTNVAGTLLTAGQAEMQIPGGQPYLVAWLVPGSRGKPGICKALMSRHCLLEVDVSRVPHSLARSEPVVYSWNLRGLSCPWKEWGLVAKYALKRREAGGVLSEGVLCILGPWEEAAPALLIFLAVCPEVMSEFLDLPLSLAVRQWMVTGGQAHRDP